MLQPKHHVDDMTQTSCRIFPKRGHCFGVEITEAGAVPRSLGSFNVEAEAWGWVIEQQRISELTKRWDADLLRLQGTEVQ